jgi:hypothetical protein
MKEIQKILRQGFFPIIHLSREDKFCPDCYSSDKEHCFHYSVVTSLNFDHKCFTCRLVTNSGCCQNIELDENEYVLNLFKKHLVFNYISSNDNLFSLDCLNGTTVSGHFKYLPN